MKRCPRCGVEKEIGEFYRNKARADGLSAYCVACFSVTQGESSQTLRARALAHLGGKCQRCGFADARALQIDHVAGDGAVERAKRQGQNALYRAVMADDGTRYALLCANCNVIKRIEQKEHGTRKRQRVRPTERIPVAPRHRTPEQKAAFAEQSRARWRDPEYRAKMVARNSEVAKARWASGEKLGRSRREAPIS